MAGSIQMERSLSTASTAVETTEHSNTGNMAPWEKDVPQVPYLTPGSMPLAQFEKRQPPSTWPPHYHNLQAPGNVSSHRHSGSRGRSPSPATSSLSVASLLTSQSLPGFAPRTVSEAPRSAPQLPAFARRQQETPSCSGSFPSSATSSAQVSPSLPVEQQVKTVMALPGTMSAREQSRPRAHASRSKRRDEDKETPETLTLGKKFKNGLNNVFKRRPMEKFEVEAVRSKHWADDDM